MPPVRGPFAEAGPSSVRSKRGPPEPSTACPAEAPARGATDSHTAQRPGRGGSVQTQWGGAWGWGRRGAVRRREGTKPVRGGGRQTSSPSPPRLLPLWPHPLASPPAGRAWTGAVPGPVERLAGTGSLLHSVCQLPGCKHSQRGGLCAASLRP